MEYTSFNDADYPEYIVERKYFGARSALLDDFAIPPQFEQDVFTAVPELSPRRCTPAWLTGGPRSGSPLHTDPLATCGWNVCLLGTKRWAMLSPGTDVRALGLDQAPAGPAGWFFDHVYVDIQRSTFIYIYIYIYIGMM